MRLAGAAALSFVLLAASPDGQSGPSSQTARWPGFGGPRGDFSAEAVPLANGWSADGPKRLWTRPLGQGHSGIAVDRGRVFTIYRPASTVKGTFVDREIVAALDAATGKTLWEHSYPAPSATIDFSNGPGPHGTPVVAGNRVFAAGTNKQFFALDADSGRVLWTRDFVKEFGAPGNALRYPVKPGYAASPLAYRDLVILMVGGSGQGVMALRQSDGQVVWKGGTFSDIAQATPVLINVQGQDQLVVTSNDGVHGMDPQTGAALWGPIGNEKQYGAHMSTPVWNAADRLLFFSAAYSGGGKVIQLSQSGGKTRHEELWFSSKMRIHFGNVIRIGDYYYGSSGDFGPSFVTAVHATTGEVKWQDRAFAKANFLRAGDRVILLDEDGMLALVTLTPEKMTVHARAAVAAATAWTAPALVGTTLYVRDRANIMALDVGAH